MWSRSSADLATPPRFALGKDEMGHAIAAIPRHRTCKVPAGPRGCSRRGRGGLMPDLILHDIEPDLLDRVRRLADTRGCSLEASLLDLLQQGLACARQRDNSLDDFDARVLREAIAALENVP